MSSMFEGAAAFNQNIGTKSVPAETPYIAWNTVAVTNMNSMFKSATIFNQYIGNWNTSAVTNMSNMFESARAFNQDIVTKSVSGIESSPYVAWNTSVVTNMSNMFNGALLFNQNIRFWSIISVTNMTNMLSGATAFAATYGTGTTTGYAETPLSIFFLFRPSTKQDLINAVNAWTSRVVWQAVPNYPQWHIGTTNTDAHDTSATTVTSSNNTHNSESRIKFQHISTTAFTLNFDYIVSAEAWYDYLILFQTKNGGSTERIFSTQHTRNNSYVAGTYNSGTLTAGTYTFEFSYYKDYSVHTGNDNVQVSNINIGNTAAYNNVPIANWDTSLITDMSELFKDKTIFNNDISNWNTIAVTNMSNMFEGATAFNQNIGNWNTSAVTNMSYMFKGATAFNQPIGDWNTSRTTNMSYMFNDAPAFDQNIIRWNTNSVSVTDYLNMFNGATAMNSRSPPPPTPLTSSYFNQTTPITQSNIQAAVNTWVGRSPNTTTTYGHIKNWGTSTITDMSNLFQNKTTFNDDISDWNVSAVMNMSSMFQGASAFNQNIRGWNVDAVTNYTGMFLNATAMLANQSPPPTTPDSTYFNE